MSETAWAFASAKLTDSFNSIKYEQTKLDGVVFLLSISRRDLYGEIWSVGMTKVAKKLDIPYDKLKKACVNHDIPLPTQTYWSKLYK